ncbi:DMT family transporter [Patescibacteria group bacterium]
MSWQVLVFLSVVLYSVSILLQRVIMKEDESKPIAFSIFFQVLSGLVILIVGLIFSDMSLPSNICELIWNLLLMGLLYGFFNLFALKSLKLTEASKYSIVASTRVFFTVLASSVLLKEFLSGPQFVGALLIFAGVVLVNLESKKFKLDRGTLLALAGAACFGFANTNDRYLLGSFDVYTYLTISFLLPPILMSLIYPKQVKYMKNYLDKKVIKKVLVLSIFYAFAALTFFAALQVGENSSQVASIGLTTVVVTVILATIFLKERDNMPKKIFAALLSLVGLLLLT